MSSKQVGFELDVGSRRHSLLFIQANGEVQWDVTDDVLAGASSWLIKKTDDLRRGQVRYFSKEGAEDLNDLNLASSLILEP